jgi:hypothetical protein
MPSRIALLVLLVLISTSLLAQDRKYIWMLATRPP